jgi:hypothetical protein
MRTHLIFDLPEEESQHRQALDGGKWEAVVWNLDQALRNWVKYGNELKSVDDALEQMRNKLHAEMENEGLNFSP